MKSMTIREYNGLPDEALAVRTTVFVEEQGFVDEFDEIDRIAVHFIAFDENVPIGTCRIFTQDGGSTFLLGRLCVLAAYRGRGVGRQLVAAAEAGVRQRGGGSLALHSQYHAKEFYAALGYTAYGDVEDEQGCPHIWMKKEIV